ncbi:hypothetical protein HYW20_03250 [Candidatus Woesearchaeota archaeon]|nr:hypothetical protein [Candidatus Woesearchaeota archaeon]
MISVRDVPKPGERKPGEFDMIIAWFPTPLLPIEERILCERGATIDEVVGQKGYLIQGSLGTLSYEKAQELKEYYLKQIKQNPKERCLAFYAVGRTHQ